MIARMCLFLIEKLKLGIVLLVLFFASTCLAIPVSDFPDQQTEAIPIESMYAEVEISQSNLKDNDDILNKLSMPEIAYILLLIGIYAILLEMVSPGLILPGIIGLASLFGALYGFYSLPMSGIGLWLMITGILLVALEAYYPKYGLLVICGTVVFLWGSIRLYGVATLPGELSLGTIIMATIGNTAIIYWMSKLAIKAYRKPVVTGLEQMTGEVGIAISDFSKAGQIKVRGEIWAASANQSIKKGDSVRVLSVDGLKLNVGPIKED